MNDDALKMLMRQLREIKGVKEVRTGVLQHRNQPFVNIVTTGDAPVAELRKAGAGGFDRFAIDTPAQRKLVDEAKRRAARSDEA